MVEKSFMYTRQLISNTLNCPGISTMSGLRVRKFSILLFSIILLCSGLFQGVAAQEAPEEEMFSIVTMDEHAYIYHTTNIGLVNGFHVERRVEGEEWEQLTEEPVFPASDGAEFHRAVGEELFSLLQETTEQDTAQEVFLTMMTRRDYGFIGSMLYPEIARALGRLYVDEDPPPVGSLAEYRFVITNSRGEPTGESLRESVQIDPQMPESPDNLTASHEGADVSLEWEFPGLDFYEDGVSLFQIYEQDGEDRIPFIEEGGTLRRTDVEEHSYTIEVDELNREYEIFVVAIDAAGQESEPSESIFITPEDNIPPDPITNIDLNRVAEDAIEITWPVSSDPDADGYHVFRYEQDEDEEWQQLTDEQLDVLQNVYIDSTITGSSHYNYKLRVYDEHGNESDPSNESSMFIEEFEPPEPVAGLEGELGEDDTITLSWEDSPTDNINSYSVIRREVHPDESDSYSQVNDGRLIETSITDAGITGADFPEGRTMEYGVAAVGPSSMQSDTVTTTVHIPLTTPPEPPVDIEATSAEADRVNIRWGASTSSTVTSYHVYRLDQPEEREIPGRQELEEQNWEGTKVTETTPGNRFIRDEEAETGQSYQYFVSAVDSADNFSEPAVSEMLEHRSDSPPHPVRNVQAHSVDGDVTLRWEPVNSEELDGYIIYRSTIATGAFEPVAEMDEDETEWVDPDGEPGNWYRVLAVDASGNTSRETRATQATE